MRRLVILACFVALAGCLRPPPKPPYVPAPDANDYKAREDCLYRTVCNEIAERGTSPMTLDGIASSAGTICEQPIAVKMTQHAASYGRVSVMNDEITDEHIAAVEFERHALSVAEEMKDECARKK